MDERVMERLRAPRSGPDAVLYGPLGDHADNELTDVIFAELLANQAAARRHAPDHRRRRRTP